MEDSRNAKAYLSQLRMTPRKVQIVLDLIRGKDATLAAAILKNTNKVASEPISKLLKSAMSNAEFKGMNSEKCFVSQCFVTPGKLKGMKRVMPRAQGRAFRIIKRTSHITIVLTEKE